MGEIKIVDGILLILALTTDSFVVSFAYGMAKTKMPFFIVAGMNLMMSSLLGAAVLIGNFFLPSAGQFDLLGGNSSVVFSGNLQDDEFFLSERDKFLCRESFDYERGLYFGICAVCGQSGRRVGDWSYAVGRVDAGSRGFPGRYGNDEGRLGTGESVSEKDQPGFVLDKRYVSAASCIWDFLQKIGRESWPAFASWQKNTCILENFAVS